MKTLNQHIALIAELLAHGDFETAEDETVKAAIQMTCDTGMVCTHANAVKAVKGYVTQRFNATYCDDSEVAA